MSIRALLQLAKPPGFPLTSCRSIFTVLESIPATNVTLASERYPEVKRGKYATLSPDDISVFLQIMGDDTARIVTDPETLIQHSCDWLKSIRGASPLLLYPRTSVELSGILKYCQNNSLAVVPQGANTSMVGGSVPIFDEIIINTSLMNEIKHIDPIAGVIVSGPGASLETLDNACAKEGLYFPMDYKIREAQLGGIVAADIAGPRTSRFGNLHGNVLGLEVVLPDGTILDSMSLMKKDNTGYDLKQMFIGSEGSLGVITKVAISCPPLPKHINVAMLCCKSFDQVLAVYDIAKDMLGEILSACEFMDNSAVMSVKWNYLTMWGIPNQPFYILIETSGAYDPHDEAKLTSLFNVLKEKQLIADGTVGPLNRDDPKFVERLWNINNRILTSLAQQGYVYQYDLSLPHKSLYPVVEELRSYLKDEVIKVASCGHLLDGNIHMSIVGKHFDTKTLKKLNNYIINYVQYYRGAVSAELGCGFKYRNLGHYCKDRAELDLMKKVKRLLDPRGIMNPYKVFPDEPEE